MLQLPKITGLYANARATWGNWRADRGKRVLVNEILTIQIMSAVVIGALAIAALYWGGQWVLKDSYSRWAMQWTAELNELGAPLYLDDDGEALLRLESFVDRYPEIDRVNYYSANGEPIFTIANDSTSNEPALISSSRFDEARALVGADEPYVISGGIVNPRLFNIVAPIWVESLSEADLFDFDPTAGDTPETSELIGFVSIQLDYLIFHNELLANIKTAILILVVLLCLFVWTSRRALQKALSSFSDLQSPIKQLAKGNLDVEFKPAQHREISDIVEALEKTASALSERDSRLLQLANHDALTGLFNRRRFIEDLRAELADFKSGRRASALFFIDLDRFKYVNDSCGHPAGDRLIQSVAAELQESIRTTDTVARFGGDEFLFQLPRMLKTNAYFTCTAALALK